MTERRKFLKQLGIGAAAVLTPVVGTGVLVNVQEEDDEETPIQSREDQREFTDRPQPPYGGESTQPSDENDEEDKEKNEEEKDGIGVGVYLGDDSALVPWEEWFGCRVDYYTLNVQRDGWGEYRIRNMPLETPIEQVAADRQLVVTMPMFPSDQTGMEAVASGEHADKYQRFGKDFVARGLNDVYFRFGAEMNGRWSTDTAVDRPDQYIRAWKEIAEALDSVAGSEFEYIWAPNIGEVHIPAPRAYPGDDYVDQIGLTLYDAGRKHYPYPDDCDSDCMDRRRRKNWEYLVEQRYGLDYWASFARDHDKPLVFPEYGIAAEKSHLQGGGDNPHFFKWFDDWMRSNDDVVEWHVVWSWVSGKHYVGPERLFRSEEYPSNPEASKTFRRLFGYPPNCDSSPHNGAPDIRRSCCQVQNRRSMHCRFPII